VQRRLKAIRHRHIFRQLTPLDHGTPPWITRDQRSLLNLSSNNYLGLADHPRLKEAAIEAIRIYGCGTGSSRLIVGTTVLHEQLEQRLAAFKGSEQALLFGSGYHANMGVIASLAGPRDVILGDELNHASIIDGCHLSGADYKTYPHLDTNVLAQQLETLEQEKHQGLRLVVTDSVFSMDGDVAPLEEIAALCEQYDALLIVDEAHATGCLGPGGRGLIAEHGLVTANIVTINTLSKAFGSIGAFVSASTLLKEYLVNVARHFIFTTALPPADIAAGLAALDILEENPELPQRLQNKATTFRTGLQELGFQTLASETHIIPLLVKDSTIALQMASELREHGVYAVAIRPPTVPMGAARVRFSIMASHTEEDLAFALDVIKNVGKKMGIIK
jgi:8-amino-7-oxononanoate synthase